MFSPRSALLVVALLVLESCGSQAFGQNPQAGKLLVEAVGLHREQKPTLALGKVKAAAALAKNNKVLLDYQAELTEQADREALSQHALKSTPEVEATTKSLATYLAAGGKTEREKAFLIYRWITDRIEYDVEGLKAGRPQPSNYADILKQRKVTCRGYAMLFMELCREAGLTGERVEGYAKGDTTLVVETEEQARINHTWNVVKLDGQWALVDATWGAVADKTGPPEKRYQPHWFDVPPEEFILSHFTVILPKWHLLKEPVPRETFDSWQRVDTRLVRLGFTVQDLRSKLQDKNLRALVEPGLYPGPKITVRSAPLERHLKAGTRYTFTIQATGFQEMRLVNEAADLPMSRKENLFEGAISPRKGTLLVGGRFWNSPKEVMYVLKYQVE